MTWSFDENTSTMYEGLSCCVWTLLKEADVGGARPARNEIFFVLGWRLGSRPGPARTITCAPQLAGLSILRTLSRSSATILSNILLTVV